MQKRYDARITIHQIPDEPGDAVYEMRQTKAVVSWLVVGWEFSFREMTYADSRTIRSQFSHLHTLLRMHN